MSGEIVAGPTGLYVITGSLAEGYRVHRVGPPIATYERKYVARRDIRFGEIDATEDGGS